MAAMFDLTMKKKKKKPKKETAAATTTEVGEDNDQSASAGKDSENIKESNAPETAATTSIYDLDPPTYTYSQLLNRVVDFVHQNNPELTDKKRFTMKPPQLMRGTHIYFTVPRVILTFFC